MATAIKVENLSKIYRLGEIGTGTISRDIERFVKTKILKQEDPFLKIGEANDRATKGTSDIVYSLRDINFEIEQGDAVGIIGRNGAGKSTLLKILSRVTSPTTGKINIKGRVASLLEVGTGFHPELTGRENIYLNGAILGMRKQEIDRKLDEIIDFSGVERYIDTPVKRYSSGMYVRLAFAVAAHLESEILIIDEVLAVGDAEFQKKCLGKMGEVSKGEGRTVLFVSHNMAAVEQLTIKSIYLENGNKKFEGATPEVLTSYLNFKFTESNTIFYVADKPRKYHGNYSAKFLELRFNRQLPIFNHNDNFEFIASVISFNDVKNIRISITIFNQDGSAIGSCFSESFADFNKNRNYKFLVSLTNHNLAPGHYYCGVCIGQGNYKSGYIDFDVVLETLNFEIRQEGEAGTMFNWQKGWGNIVYKSLNAKLYE